MNFRFFGHLQKIVFYRVPFRLHSDIVEHWRHEVRNEEVDDEKSWGRNENQTSGDDLSHPDEEVEPGFNFLTQLQKTL